MKRDYYVAPKASRIMRLLWSAAGGDRFILERSTYSDQIKYMCLGGIIVATGVMAAIAGGYAFYTIFSPKEDVLEAYKQMEGARNGLKEVTDIPTAIMSIIFGCIWGLIIFNLDRFIVSSTGKGDGTEAITWEEFKGAIPRIIMGIIIAVTISKPVEIRMFKSEIDCELAVKQQKQLSVYKEEINKNESPEINRINGEIKRIQDNLNFLVQNEGIARKDLRDCLMKMLPCPQNKGLYNEAKKAREDYEAEIKPKLIALEKEKADALGGKKNIDDKAKVKAAQLDGLLERIKILHEIAPYISFFITLLFLAIELTPIFFKLMLIKSPYDYLKDNIEDLIKADEGIYIEHNYYKDKVGQERDLVIHFAKEKANTEKKELLETQRKLTQYALEKYEALMKQKIDSNPELYIKSEIPTNDASR